ncbi:MAG: hypothetical protein Kow00124_18400 [Anaerolineae bacterium]
MVCPYKSPETKKAQEEAAHKAEAAGSPDHVRQLLKDLTSPDPEVRRRAAVMFEVSSLGALNEAEDWREEPDSAE